MSYQVLARKWRPKNFSEMVGQEHVVRALSNALDQNRLHHAYLLTGTRGVGKTTLGRIIAKCLNCLSKGVGSQPCGVCAACTEIDRGRFVDMVELDAASNTGIDNMREVLDNAQYAPSSGRFKVYLIDEVHMLSKAAFNSMLKTLEEPPEHVKFILATTDPQKIPVTVLSRCLQFGLKQMSQLAISGHLAHVLGQEAIAFEPGALALLARAAQGSMRDALSLTDQAIAHGGGEVKEAEVRAMLGAVDQTYLYDLLDGILNQDGVAVLNVADSMAARSISLDAALQDLGVLLHQIALAQTVPDALSETVMERPRILAWANAFDPDEIQLYYQIVLHGRKDLYLAPDEYAGFSMTLLRMLAFRPETAGTGTAKPAAVAQRKTTVQASIKQAPAAPSKEHAAPETRVTRQESSATIAAESPPPALACAPNGQASPAFDGDWIALVDKLKLSGMAKMLAQHCALNDFSDQTLNLILPPEHKHLADKSYKEKLRTTLSDWFGTSIKLNIEFAEPASLTPLQVQRHEKAARDQRAIEAIEQDPFVAELREQFDAKVIESTIKPLQSSPE